MCLYKLKTSPTFVATKDRICYKVLRSIQHGAAYESPFIHMNVRMMTRYDDKDQERFVLSDALSDGSLKAVREGGYHLLAKEEDAFKYIKEWEGMCPKQSGKLVVVKAIIPQGTKYVVGKTVSPTSRNTFKTVATKSVIYVPLHQKIGQAQEG